jgi:hypothetical protein
MLYLGMDRPIAKYLPNINLKAIDQGGGIQDRDGMKAVSQ